MAAGVVWVALKGHPLGVTRHHCSVGGPMGMLRAVCPHGPPWYPRVRYGTPWVPIPSPHRSLRFHPRSAPSHSAGAMVVLRAGLCPGLTEEMIQLLRANNIRTVVDFVSSDLEDVAQSCSLSYKALVAVRRVLLAQFSAFPTNGADLYEELKSSTAILPTGNPSLDQLLDAGLYTGEVTELAGAPGSGKTQVCLSIAASVSLGLRQHVFFLDSTGGFTASRLYQMLQARVEDKEEQVESSAGPLKAVLIDSVSAVLSPLLGGRQSEGLAIMMQLARELKTLAKEFSVAVVVTNQVTRDSSTGALKSALGRSWSFVPSTRVLLQGRAVPWEDGAAPHTACLAKSPRQPTGMQVQLDIGSDAVQEQRPVTPTP
ncbi:DNA repair protein RAD51 homolog 4 isoform X2 [Gallus gallus]|uniref:DNA repair protein RAD51 homolog 4 isoform X2 n=2 Tax=Gallus gallus TaxID=9031 RepID=UPI001F0206D8|nr:DNA repair protein RAD51 homolog 4 isoform X2 [Gallus gallus]